MYRFIFQNRRAALLFVALMALSATQLVGTDKDSGALGKVEQSLIGQRADMEASFEQPAQAPVVTPAVAEEEWADDEASGMEEDWVDSGEGYDPSPEDDYTEPMIEE